jgi:hypothetical protein
MAGQDNEIERLRSLVGPSEDSYEALRRDVAGAQQTAREALAETGQLRGQIVELGVQLSRARQDQDVLLRRADMSTLARLQDRVASRWAASVQPRLPARLKRRR